MRVLAPALSILVVFAGACSGGTAAPAVEVSTHPAERSEITFQVVDAGTGGALTDTLMTVRHLVRYPITLDSSAIDRVPSAEPYHIAHMVSQDSLVVEVRVEARSYHRMDTVLAVDRGASAGPLTLRMARRLERTARRPAAAPARGGGVGTPSTGAPSTAPSAPDADIDQRPLEAGNRAFRAGDWLAAADAYGRMPPPTDRTSPYAKEYTQALVRLGLSHIDLGEMAGALDALEKAVEYPHPGYAAYLYLGRAQCAVGRLDDGRRTLRIVRGAASAGERPLAAALAQHDLAVCDYRAYKQATSTMDRLRTGSTAVQALQAFIRVGESTTPSQPALRAAVADARTKVAEIQDRMRRGGGAP